MQNFEDLHVWQRARNITKQVYEATTRYPEAEKYNLTSQTRRSSVAIAANIAEGAGRGSRPDFSRMLQIASGEASELQSHLIVASDLGFLPTEVKDKLTGVIAEVRKMIAGLTRSLKKDD